MKNYKELSYLLRADGRGSVIATTCVRNSPNTARNGNHMAEITRMRKHVVGVQVNN